MQTNMLHILLRWGGEVAVAAAATTSAMATAVRYRCPQRMRLLKMIGALGWGLVVFSLLDLVSASIPYDYYSKERNFSFGHDSLGIFAISSSSSSSPVIVQSSSCCFVHFLRPLCGAGYFLQWWWICCCFRRHHRHRHHSVTITTNSADSNAAVVVVSFEWPHSISKM